MLREAHSSDRQISSKLAHPETWVLPDVCARVEYGVELILLEIVGWMEKFWLEKEAEQEECIAKYYRGAETLWENVNCRPVSLNNPWCFDLQVVVVVAAAAAAAASVVVAVVLPAVAVVAA